MVEAATRPAGGYSWYLPPGVLGRFWIYVSSSSITWGSYSCSWQWQQASTSQDTDTMTNITSYNITVATCLFVPPLRTRIRTTNARELVVIIQLCIMAYIPVYIIHHYITYLKVHNNHQSCIVLDHWLECECEAMIVLCIHQLLVYAIYIPWM